MKSRSLILLLGFIATPYSLVASSSSREPTTEEISAAGVKLQDQVTACTDDLSYLEEEFFAAFGREEDHAAEFDSLG